jgi:CRP-like cAMP-binding protein/tetratricopeptide (TPR) repeat protein
MNPIEADEFASRFPDEIRMLLAMLRMSNLGGLAVAECDDLDLRSRLLDYFRRRLEAEGIYLYRYEVSAKETNLVRSLTELTDHSRFKNLELTGKYKAIVIFVIGIEKYNDEQRRKFITLLNFLRDRLTLIAQPIIIWGAAKFVTELARNAPDFWSWKGHFFSFNSGAPAKNNIPDNHESNHPQDKLPPIQRYLRRLLQDPDYGIWKDLYLPLKASRAFNDSPYAPRHTLSYEELRQLAPLLPHTISREANKIIFRQGQKGDRCFVIVSGRVEILTPDALENDIVIATLGKGDFFGEIALLKGIPRTATTRTARPSKFVEITADSLNLIKQKAPAVFHTISQVANRRLEARMQDPQEIVSPLRRFAMEGVEGGLQRHTPIDVRELIASDQHAVILGEAGAGKTTALRRLMFDKASQAEHILTNSPDAIILPIFIKLNTLTPGKTIKSLMRDIFTSYDIHELETDTAINNLLNGQSPDDTPLKGLCFLLDGLNEMPAQQKTRPKLDQFISQNNQHYFILSCRTPDYIGLDGFQSAVLQRLGGEDIEAFLVNYLRAEKGRQVAKEIYSDPQLEDLAQSPLALYMFAQIAKRGDEALPKNRGVLFDVFTNELLERTDSEWWKIFGRSKSRAPLRLRRNILSELGIAMQSEEVWTYPYTRWIDLINRALRAYHKDAPTGEMQALKHITAQDIHEEIKYSGLVRYSNSRTKIEFAHHTYQEFFAALALRSHVDQVSAHLDTSEDRRRWQGTIVLLYGIAHDKIELYSKILGVENNYARIWLAAQCLANSGEDTAATLNKLERSLPMEQHFALLFSVGLTSRQLGRYPEALSYLHMAVEENPASAEVQSELGSLYRQVDQFERAIVHLEEAIRLKSDSVDVYNQLGLTYYAQKKYVEALTVFRATTQLEPHNAYHYYNAGTVYKILRDYKSARHAFRTALRLKPDYTEAKTQLDILEKALSTGVIQVLEKIPILSKMTLEQSVLLANRIQVVEYQPGQIVFHMGEMGDTFYIIEMGEVEVLAPEIGKHQTGVINRLGPGNFFGEIALLRAVPRTATIRATKPTRLLAISRQDFDSVVKKYPSIAHRLAETSSLRLLRDRQIGRRVDLDRYYDPGYIAELTSQNKVTVIMGDIHGSTFLTNSIGPELMVAFLDEYLLRMSSIIVQAGGAMDKSLGDSVMGVFGNTPEQHDDETVPVKAALMAAFKMREAYVTLRDKWKRQGSEFSQTGMGIGVSTGKVKTGTVGPEATMVGPAVNMSSKLSKMAIRGRTESEIYIDAPTRRLAGASVRTEALDVAYTKKKVGVELEAYRVIEPQ